MVRCQRTLARTLRALRLIVACLALAVAATPALASVCTDAFAWVATVRAEVEATAPASEPRSFGSLRNVATSLVRSIPSAVGARARVVQRRLYLRYSALLC